MSVFRIIPGSRSAWDIPVSAGAQESARQVVIDAANAMGGCCTT